MTESSGSTVAELESRLRDLELRFLGPPSETTSCPFAPVSAYHSRIEKFRSFSVNADNTDHKDRKDMKLPAVKLPTFDGSDLDTFLRDWERWLRLSGAQGANDKFKCDWLIESCTPKIKRLVEKVDDEKAYDLVAVLTTLETLFPKLENDMTVRANLDKIAQLPQTPEPSTVAQLILEMEELFSRLSDHAMSDQEKFLLLMKKLHPKTFSELRQDRYYKLRTEDYKSLKCALIEKFNEDWMERHILQQKKQSLQPLAEPGTIPTGTPTILQGSRPDPPSKRVKGGGKGDGKGSSPIADGKGKGKGKSQGKGKGKSGSSGRSRSVAPDSEIAHKFSATIFCKWCKKKGHYEDFCWAKDK